MDESVRRTVLLVNAINVLSCRIEKQERLFFESLDRETVQIMTLPAPDVLWKASTAEEWAAVKQSLVSGITMAQALQQLATAGHIEFSPGTVVKCEDLDEFSQLVIFTTGIEQDL